MEQIEKEGMTLKEAASLEKKDTRLGILESSNTSWPIYIHRKCWPVYDIRYRRGRAK